MVLVVLACELDLRARRRWWQFSFGPPGGHGPGACGRVRPARPPAAVGRPGRAGASCRADRWAPDTIGRPHWARLWCSPATPGSTSLLELALPDGCDTDLGDYWLHPALLDRGTSTGTPVLDEDDSYLPFTYRRLVVHRPIPGRCVAVQRHEPAAAGDEWLRNDVLIVDQDVTVCVEIEGFTLRHVAAADRAAVQAGPAGPVDLRTWLDDTLTWWAAIEPAEGVELLQRVLAFRPGPRWSSAPRHAGVPGQGEPAAGRDHRGPGRRDLRGLL